MATGNVSNRPLNVVVDFYWNVLNASAQGNSQYARTQAPIKTFLPFASAALQAQLAPLLAFLSQPLGSFFNSQYAAQLPALQQAAITLVTQQAAAAGHPVNTVTATLPPSGTLVAETADAQPGYLDLTFQLPGCAVRFEWGSITAYWVITFDAALNLYTPVPLLPFSLDPTTTLEITNTSGPNADSLVAEVESAADVFLTAVGDFFTGENFVALITIAQTNLPKTVNGSQAVPPFSNQFQALLTALNGAGPQVVAYGFTQCAFSIANGNTLTLTVTHPLDPGPQVEDFNVASGVLRNHPTLAANAAQAAPGSTIFVTGYNFPIASDSQLPVRWPNTSSGPPVGAQLQYGIVGQGNPTTVSLPAPVGGIYAYTATPLQPNTQYSFSARCGDTLTWSKWSEHPLEINTAETAIADLVLVPASVPPGGPGVVLGHTALSQSLAQWNCQGTLPASTPPGTYNLVARLHGEVIAFTPLVISTKLTPDVAIVDPGTGAIIEPVLTGGSQFTLRCSNFPDGTLDVFFDGKLEVQQVGTTGEFFFLLNVPGSPTSEVGVLTITASVGSVSAPPLIIHLVTPPK